MRELNQAASSFILDLERVYLAVILDQTASSCWQKKLSQPLFVWRTNTVENYTALASFF